MVELKLYVSDVDFEALLKMMAGSGNAMGMNAIAMAARALPDSAKEEMAVKYINGSAGKIGQLFENAAAAKGVRMKITGAQASVVKK